MKYIQISKAYETLTELGKIKFSFQTSREIYNLKKSLKDTAEFMSNEEGKIVQSYNGILNRDGSVSFSGDDKEDRFSRCFTEINLLHNLDIEFDFKSIIIPQTETNDKTISGEEIERLEGFVIFE